MTDTENTVLELAKTAQDATKPMERRRTALRLLCQLRGESGADVDTIREDELNPVVAGMVQWPSGLEPLTMADAQDSIREGRMRREMEQRRR